MRTVLLFQSAFNEVSEHREFDGVNRYARMHGWNLRIIPNATRIPSVADAVRFWAPDGCIIANIDDLQRFDRAALGTVPAVYLDCHPKQDERHVCCVTHDSRATAEMAAKELQSLNYPNYAYVAWFEPLYWSRRRLEGFRAALAINGRTTALCEPLPRERRDLIRLQRRLKTFLTTVKRPCAVFAANDELGAQVIAAAGAAGLRVPDDIAVIGVDNNETTCENSRPQLSSILPDYSHGGYQAAAILDRRMSKPSGAPEQGLFGPLCVIRRASTCPITAHDSRVVRAIEFIRAHAAEHLGVDDVAAEMRISRRLAEIRFREVTGHSIRDEIMSVRLENVKNLLAQGTASMTAIAQRCGWNSLPVLCRYFRKATGMTLTAAARKACLTAGRGRSVSR